jgi:hypothetical protein
MGAGRLCLDLVKGLMRTLVREAPEPHLASYRANGYLVLPGFFDEARLARADEATRGI